MNKKVKFITIIALVFILINLIAGSIFYRWDFTKDKRYTIANSTISILNKVSQPLTITVYLSGDIPADFQKLSNETKFFLEELRAENKQIKFLFVNPKGIEQNLINTGLQPSQLTFEEEGKVTETIIFPWATVQYGAKKVNVNLLKSSYFESQDTQIQNSIQNLEFAFAEAIHKCVAKKSKKVIVLKGNGELEDIFQYDWLKSVGENYYMAPFTLDSVANAPHKTLQQIKAYDLAIITKPTQAFTEAEKYTLDQFTMKGGKTIWLVDNVTAPKDSLMRSGKVLAYPTDLNLTDYFFNYGVRINSYLSKDLYGSEITLAVGNVGNNTQYNNFLWHYYPTIKTNNQHVINKNIGDVRLEFVSPLDTLNPKLKKTVLLESSVFTQNQTVPDYISLQSILDKNGPENFRDGKKIFGVLVEGNFNSAYKNRVKPISGASLETGKNNQMIVISDGDMSSNQIHEGQPLELGLDKWTNKFYANKEFLMNAVNYLLDDNGLIQLRSKKVTINHINKPKAYEEKTFWQLINIITPIALILISFSIHQYLRKKKYTR